MKKKKFAARVRETLSPGYIRGSLNVLKTHSNLLMLSTNFMTWRLLTAIVGISRPASDFPDEGIMDRSFQFVRRNHESNPFECFSRPSLKTNRRRTSSLTGPSGHIQD